MQTTTIETPSAQPSKLTLWIGRILAGLVALFLLFDAVTKIAQIGPVVDAFKQQGIPLEFAPSIGGILLVSLVLYLVPRTSFFGAILLTGFLGGAIFANLRIGQPVYFPAAFAIFVWVSLYLRNQRLRALVKKQAI